MPKALLAFLNELQDIGMQPVHVGEHQPMRRTLVDQQSAVP